MNNTNELFDMSSGQLDERARHRIENFNRGRNDERGVYLISMATHYRPYYALWRLFADNEYPLFIRSLAITLDEAVSRATDWLAGCNVMLRIGEDEQFEQCYGVTEDLIPFGKYRGKHMAEVYSIDPSYVLWIANSFNSNSKKYDALKEFAKAFSVVHIEMASKRGSYSSLSRYVGEEGTRLKDLYLSVLNVRLQADTYKPDFYVDQNVLAVDKDGNRFVFYIKAGGRSLSPNQLSCYTRVIEKHETLHVLSAKVMKHFSRGNAEYTKLGYVKLE